MGRVDPALDGEAFHTSASDVLHDAWRRALIAGGRGWRVETFVRADVYGPTQDADLRLRAAYGAARAREAPRRSLLVL